MVSSTLACGHGLGQDDGDIAADGREGRHGLVALGLRGAGEPRVERDFGVEDRDLDAVDFEVGGGDLARFEDVLYRRCPVFLSSKAIAPLRSK